MLRGKLAGLAIPSISIVRRCAGVARDAQVCVLISVARPTARLSIRTQVTRGLSSRRVRFALIVVKVVVRHALLALHVSTVWLQRSVCQRYLGLLKRLNAVAATIYALFACFASIRCQEVSLLTAALAFVPYHSLVSTITFTLSIPMQLVEAVRALGALLCRGTFRAMIQ